MWDKLKFIISRKNYYPASNVAGSIGTKNFYWWCMRGFCFGPIRCLWKLAFKVARYSSYHKNPAQESRTQNRVTIFTRKSRKLINKMKRTSKMTWREQLLAPYHAIARVLYQLLTSLEFSILEKQYAISLYFVWWPMFKFCMLYCTAKNFHFTKNKKIL
jgi:hypothetical protein